MLIFYGKSRDFGFTLVETIIYFAVFVVVMFIIFSLTIWIYGVNERQMMLKEITDNVRRTLSVITYEIRGAEGLYGSTSNVNQLSLRTSRYTGAGESEGFIDFFICGVQVCMKQDSQAEPAPLTSEKVMVKNLSFAYMPSSSSTASVQISLILEHKNSALFFDPRLSGSATSSASLRTY